MSNQFAGDVDVDLRAVFGAIGRALPILLVVALLVAAGTYVLLGTAAPRYRAETMVLIETGESAITRATDAAATVALLDQQGIASQVQLIRSRAVALAVIEQLRLTEAAEFDPAQAPPSLFARLLGFVGLGGGEEAPTAPAVGVVLDDFLTRLEVIPIAQTRVISIAFVSSDPQLAADIANAVAQQYIAQQRSVQRETTAGASQWLEGGIARLSARVVAAEEDVERFRARSDLFRTGITDVTIIAQRLADTSAELQRIRTARAEAEAKAALIRVSLESGRSLSSLEVLNSPLVQRLREQEVLLRSQIAEASATLLPGHPRLRELNAQLGDLEEAIRGEAMNILAGLDTEATLARSYEAQLAAAETDLKTAVAASSQAEVQLRALERVATAERDLLETYLSLAREAISRQNADYLPVNARIISSAAAPLDSYFPKKVPMSLAALIVTLMIGAAFMLMRELASGRATRPGALPVAIAAATVAAPAVEAPWSEGGDVRRMMPAPKRLRRGLAGEVERSLAAIAGQIRKHEARRILIAMAEGTADKGRPLAAVALARALARTGARVLLVDLHPDDADRVAMGEADRLPGFGDLFAGEATFAQVIFRDRVSSAHFIPTGRAQRTEDLIAGDRLPALAAVFDHTYDHVVYDIRDELIVRLGPTAAAAMLVTDAGPADARTAKAYAALRAASPAELFLLVTGEAAPDDEAQQRVEAVA